MTSSIALGVGAPRVAVASVGARRRRARIERPRTFSPPGAVIANNNPNPNPAPATRAVSAARSPRAIPGRRGIAAVASSSSADLDDAAVTSDVEVERNDVVAPVRPHSILEEDASSSSSSPPYASANTSRTSPFTTSTLTAEEEDTPGRRTRTTYAPRSSKDACEGRTTGTGTDDEAMRRMGGAETMRLATTGGSRGRGAGLAARARGRSRAARGGAPRASASSRSP